MEIKILLDKNSKGNTGTNHGKVKINEITFVLFPREQEVTRLNISVHDSLKLSKRKLIRRVLYKILHSLSIHAQLLIATPHLLMQICQGLKQAVTVPL